MMEFEMHRFTFSILSRLQASVQLLIFWIALFSQTAPLQAQTPFPLPGWFRNNVSRPAVDERSKAYIDYLNSRNKEGRLSLPEADTVRLVLEKNLDVVVDGYAPELAFYD